MRAVMRDDLKTALKARDRVAVAALRSALAAIDNAEALPAGPAPAQVIGDEHVAGSAIGVGAAEAERRLLTEADLRSIVTNEVHERTAAAGQYEQAGRADEAVRLRAEAEVLTRYLGQ